MACFLISCKNSSQVLKNNTNELSATETTVSKNETETDITEEIEQQNEVMLEKDVLFNGKLTRFFSIHDFDKTFGKPDSIKLMIEEEPCSYIFENPDGSKDMEDKYFYKDGSCFENNKNNLAVDEFRFLNGNFILFKGKKIDALTTLTEMKKIFPNAIKNIRLLNVSEEGELKVILLKEDENGVSDGHINMFFKNDKAYFMHWWFPC